MVKMELKQGDCIELMQEILDASVDLVLTDPPFGINYRSNMRLEKFDYIQNDEDLTWLPKFIQETHRVLKDNSAFYCFTRWNVYPRWHNEIKKHFNIKNCVIIKRAKRSFGGDLKSSFSFIYDMVIFANKGIREFEHTEYQIADNHSRHGEKPFKGFVYRYEDLIDDCPASERKNIVHPTQKTIDINKFFITLSSKEGDTILDPFMGSGTTGVACVNTKRNFIGYELNEEYFNIAKKRIEQELKQVIL